MEIENIKLEDIKPDPNQPRKIFNKEAIEELAQSIKELGLINPITVRKVNSSYVVVTGERRYRACLSLDLNEIPCIVNNSSDTEVALLMLIENLQRQDLTDLETANFLKQLKDEHGLSIRSLAEKTGLSKSKVQRSLSLLELPEEFKKALEKGELTHSVLNRYKNTKRLQDLRTNKAKINYIDFRAHKVEVIGGYKYGPSYLDTIISNMPYHSLYIEPFCNLSYMYFYKGYPEDVQYKELLNDNQLYIYNLFKCLQNKESRTELLTKLHNTLFSKETIAEAVRILWNSTLKNTLTNIDVAWASYILYSKLNNMSPKNNFLQTYKNGNLPVEFREEVIKLNALHNRFSRTLIENTNPLTIISNYNEPFVLLYIHPPKIEENKLSGYKEEDFIKLIEALKLTTASFILHCSPNEHIPSEWKKINLLGNQYKNDTDCIWVQDNSLNIVNKLNTQINVFKPVL